MIDRQRELYGPGLEAYAEAHSSAPPEWIQDICRHTAGTGRAAIMLSDLVVGRLLKIMTTILAPRLAVDVGTFTGVSALCIAEGLPPGGKVITCEVDPRQAEVAAKNIARSPHADRIDLRVGPALATLRAIEEPIGLAFIDADKEGYWTYCDAILDRLAPSGLIVVDNTLYAGTVLMSDDESTAELSPLMRRVREQTATFNRRLREDPRIESCLLTVSDGVTLISRRTPDRVG